jgi:hypothetical protein
MLLGALGFNYSRAPHLPLPEIYRRETLRFITATPGCVKFQRCRQSAARFATAHMLFDIRVDGVVTFVHTHTRSVVLYIALMAIQMPDIERIMNFRCFQNIFLNSSFLFRKSGI